jgi:cyanophycinase
MGLGIDEDTALVVRGHLGEVVGSGGVTFVDGRSVRYDTAGTTDAARRGDASALTLSYLRVGLVGAGHALDLRERELDVLVRPPADEADSGTPTVTSADVRGSEVRGPELRAADGTAARLAT